MILADFHMHTEFSTDSEASMESQIASAIEKGIKHLCFTDHMDYDYPVQYGGGFLFDMETYLARINEMKERYKKRIALYRGVELGMQPGLAERCGSLVQGYPLDFVICSSHVVDGIDPYFPDFWKGRDEKSALRRYFESILENIRMFEDFDIYGHLDYIIRYAPSGKREFSYSEYGDIIDEILKSLIQKGKGIEINSGGYRCGLGHANPHEAIITRYCELGGELITIGSDGHKPEDLAYNYKKTGEMLLSLGIRYYAIYENRTPVFLRI